MQVFLFISLLVLVPACSAAANEAVCVGSSKGYIESLVGTGAVTPTANSYMTPLTAETLDAFKIRCAASDGIVAKKDFSAAGLVDLGFATLSTILSVYGNTTATQAIVANRLQSLNDQLVAIGNTIAVFSKSEVALSAMLRLTAEKLANSAPVDQKAELMKILADENKIIRSLKIEISDKFNRTTHLLESKDGQTTLSKPEKARNWRKLVEQISTLDFHEEILIGVDLAVLVITLVTLIIMCVELCSSCRGARYGVLN